MKEKELRLAFVCYGGVSLAVYQFGITHEILNLVRASKAYHALPPADRPDATYRSAIGSDAPEPEISTEEIYFDALKRIGHGLDLRVIVDVIAGASAGGVNGVVLARAIAHDLSIAPLREMWLTEADVTRLLAPERKAKTWSKWFLRPLIWAMMRERILRLAPDREMRQKLSTFLRSRWFRAPFDGRNLTRVLIKALDAMGDPGIPGASLIPVGHKLELLVTVTDFFGYLRTIPLHDPPVVREREHRHVLRFAYRRYQSGEEQSHFDHAGVPGLAFAARATSSFPGAFPAAQIREVDDVVTQLGRRWAGRDDFLQRNFVRYRRVGMDPLSTAFVDGSVLNNKPFAEAIAAIQGRPGFREVDRRIVFIDPDPSDPTPPQSGRVPGFFTTLRGALSDIPRNEPVYDDLAWIGGFNERVRRMRTIIDAARPQIVDLVAQVTKGKLERRLTPERIRLWRQRANARAAIEAGFAYEGYVRLKLASVLDYVCGLTGEICDLPEGAQRLRWIAAVYAAWARQTGVYPEDGSVPRAALRADEDQLPLWANLLFSFDVAYRRRRLNFLIQALNRLYPRIEEPAFRGLNPEALDGVKQHLYLALDAMRIYDDTRFVSAETAGMARELFAAAAVESDPGHSMADAESFAARNLLAISALTESFARDCNLAQANVEVDSAFTSPEFIALAAPARRELLITYLGFAFWDVLTFSITNWRDLGEFNEILVDRISPQDAVAIRKGGTKAMLRGRAFNRFAGFFSRASRENDYLWGRLHGVERLLDIVVSSAARDLAAGEIDLVALKKEAFLRVLAAERPHLVHIGDLFRSLYAEVGKI